VINRSGLVLIFSALGIFPPLASWLKEKKSSSRRGSESARSRAISRRARPRRRLIAASVNVPR